MFLLWLIIWFPICAHCCWQSCRSWKSNSFELRTGAIRMLGNVSLTLMAALRREPTSNQLRSSLGRRIAWCTRDESMGPTGWASPRHNLRRVRDYFSDAWCVDVKMDKIPGSLLVHSSSSRSACTTNNWGRVGGVVYVKFQLCRWTRR